MPVGREVPILIPPGRAARGDRGKRSCGGGRWGERSTACGEWGVWRPLSDPTGTSAGKALRKSIEGGRQPTHRPVSLGERRTAYLTPSVERLGSRRPGRASGQEEEATE